MYLILQNHDTFFKTPTVKVRLVCVPVNCSCLTFSQDVAILHEYFTKNPFYMGLTNK
jgi:hypothetical protein